MTITLSALQKQRRDTAANWTAEDPTLLAGEIGIESDTGYWKVGDGSTAWTSLGYIAGSQLSAYPLVDADIAAGAEIAVSKLADGDARQLLQTDAAGTGVEWASNIDVPGTLDVTGVATFDASVTIEGDLTVNGTKVLDSTSLGSGITGSSLTSVGTIATGTWQGDTLGTAYGGTGQEIYTDGQLLIGNSTGNTLAKATLTAGTGITVTNGSGTITLAIDSDTAIADITTTATTGTLPTADGSVTIADAASPTNAELLEYCVELEAKLEAALAALRTTGVIAT